MGFEQQLDDYVTRQGWRRVVLPSQCKCSSPLLSERAPSVVELMPSSDAGPDNVVGLPLKNTGEQTTPIESTLEGVVHDTWRAFALQISLYVATPPSVDQFLVGEHSSSSAVLYARTMHAGVREGFFAALRGENPTWKQVELRRSFSRNPIFADATL